MLIILLKKWILSVLELLSFDLIIRLINMVLGFSIGLLLTRLLSLDSRAEYALFVNYSAINSIFLSFGFPDFILKNSIQLNLIISLKKYLFISVPLLLIVGLINFLIISDLLIYIVFFSLLQLFSLFFRYYLYIKRNVKYGEIYQFLISLVNVIVICIIYSFCPKSLKFVETWMFVSIISIVLVLVPYLFIFKFQYIRLNYRKSDFFDFSRFFKSLTSFGVLSLSGIILSKAIYYFMSTYSDQELIAKFSVSEIVSSVLVTFFSIITIKYSLILYNSKISHLVILKNYLGIIFAISLPAFLFLLLYGGDLFGFVYGQDYRLVGDFSYLQVIIAFLSAISSFLVVLNISIGVIYENAYPAIIVCLALLPCKLFYDTLTLFNLYLIVISINIFTISFLLFINFLKNDKRVSEA
jgi:O-antigen/teichoic acid export membrane protein